MVKYLRAITSLTVCLSLNSVLLAVQLVNTGRKGRGGGLLIWSKKPAQADVSQLRQKLERKKCDWGSLSSPPPTTSHEHQYYGLMQDFTRLFMKTKYVCIGLSYWHVNFHDNRTMQTVILIIKVCRWGAKRKRVMIGFFDVPEGGVDAYSIFSSFFSILRFALL